MTSQQEAEDLVHSYLRERNLTSLTPTFSEFDGGWLVGLIFSDPSEPQPTGGVRLVIDRGDGSIHEYSASAPPHMTILQHQAGRTKEE